MVEPFNAAIADGTVSRAWRPKDKTLRAEVWRVQFRKQVKEVMLWTQVAWVPRRRNEEGYRDYGANPRDNVRYVVEFLL